MIPSARVHADTHNTEISICTRRGHDTVLIDYYAGRAQSLYDPVMLPFTGYSVALRLALMSGDGQTDSRTDGQTDGES